MTTHDSVSEPPVSLPSARNLKITAWLSIAILVAQLPFLLRHLANLWYYRPHYEFFPFVIAAAVFLLWLRWPEGEVTHPRWSLILASFLLGFGLITTSIAVLLYSPWLAAIAFMLILGGLLLRLTGDSVRDLIGPWLLLWVVIPPPQRFDATVIRSMQQLTATLVSGILEWGGVRHLLTGFVFQLPDRELFVAEACSGIHSQLVLVAACLILAVIERRGLFGTLLLTATAAFWSLAANVTRVTIVVIAASRYQLDIASGWIHEALGYSLMLGGFLMLLSADQLLRGLLAPMRERVASRNVLARQWNRWIAINQNHDVEQEPVEDEDVTPPHYSAKPVRFAPYLAFASMLAVIGLLQIGVLAGSQATEIKIEDQSAVIDESWLPENAGGWEMSEYRTEERERSSDEGNYSCIWRYASGPFVAQVSLDYPFLGWHELSNCYLGRGWKLASRKMISPSGAKEQAEDPASYMQVELNGPSGESGFLLFSLFDAAGRPVHPRPVNWTTWQGKLARSPMIAALTGNAAISESQTTIQIQQFVVTDYPLAEAERQQLHRLFVNSRDRIQQRRLGIESN